MARMLAEQETLFRWDREEKVLWANTTHPGTAARWTEKGHIVTVIGYEGRKATSWAVRLPFTKRGAWIRLFSLSVPSFAALEQAREGSEDASTVSVDD